MRWEYGRRQRGGGIRRPVLVLALLCLAAVLVACALVRTGLVRVPPDLRNAWWGSAARGSQDAQAGGEEEYTESQFLMDTYVTIRAIGPGCREATRAAFDEMRRVEAMASAFVATSEVSRVNQAAGGEPVRVSDELFALLEKAGEYSELSGGAFDVTIGPVVKAWGFGTDEPRVPDAQTLERALSLVNHRALEMNRVDRTVRLLARGMSIDLGGIAKGYATDRAGAILREHGIEHALIDAGGNILAVGGRPDGEPWRIGIRDPRGESPAETIGPVVPVKDGAVVTSGDYERFFVADGERFHHIFDPATGKPGQRAQSATVVAKSSCDADILSTAVFVLGPVEGLGLVDAIEGVEAMVVDADGGLSFSRGFPGQ